MEKIGDIISGPSYEMMNQSIRFGSVIEFVFLNSKSNRTIIQGIVLSVERLGRDNPCESFLLKIKMKDPTPGLRLPHFNDKWEGEYNTQNQAGKMRENHELPKILKNS